MPDIKAAVVAAAEETSPTTSTDVLMLINAAGTTFKKIKLVTLFEAIDALQYKGVIDCSANPNYPAANAGHVYKVSVAGKIGGGSGPDVEAGDTLICAVDSSASGNHATVGANWGIVQANVGFSSFILTLLDDADAATARTTLGAAPATPLINAQTGTTYTLDATDNGKIVTCSNASAITVTVPSGLGAGFHCQVVQIGAGQVSFTGSGATVNNRQSHTKIAGQYGVATVEAYASNVFVLAGDTAA